MEYIKDPSKIEEISMVMIEDIANNEFTGLKVNDEVEIKVLKRVIHTSADFEYIENLKFSNDAVNVMTTAYKNGLTIYTDTNMALSGINKRVLKAMGIEAKCFIADEDVAKIAKENGITRSMASVLKAVKEPGKKLFVVGNAPTYLYKIMELREEFGEDLVGIIGVPVGFVGAAESKDELYKTDIPHITALGRKGGSNVAASIVNALSYSIKL